MKTSILLIIIMFIISCEDYYGKPVPLGDEFEDTWKRINFEGMIYQIEASKINENEFFIGGENTIYVLQDSITRVSPINYQYQSCRVISSSFHYPQRLLIGTNVGEIYYCSMDGIIRVISTPSINNIEHLCFSPFDTAKFYLASDNFLLKCDITGHDYDTIFYGSEKIVDFLIQKSGEIFLTTEHNLYGSTIQDSLWDTLFVSPAQLINGFAIDGKQRFYLSIDSKILKSENGVDWNEFYSDTIGNFSITGIEDGLLLVCYANAFKLNADGKIYDITMGIVYDFPWLSESPTLVAVNGKRYLISFSDGDEIESALLSFFDTLLPP
ncbi:MAG: hypothetical protein ACPL28_05230 [bacterium]